MHLHAMLSNISLVSWSIISASSYSHFDIHSKFRYVYQRHYMPSTISFKSTILMRVLFLMMTQRVGMVRVTIRTQNLSRMKEQRRNMQCMIGLQIICGEIILQSDRHAEWTMTHQTRKLMACKYLIWIHVQSVQQQILTTSYSEFKKRYNN